MRDSGSSKPADRTPGGPARIEELLSAEALAAAVGISSDLLVRLVRLGVIEPVASEASEFTAATAAKLRRMVRLRGDLGVGFVGAAIIVDLLQQLERLEADCAGRDPASSEGRAI
jgi:hypothetical protein